VYDESLTRVPALDRDLDHWAPGAEPTTTSDAAAAYRARIEEASTRPHLLVAHHYTRYLGDLSGGQLVAQSLRRGYAGLESDGLAFYAFPDIPKPVAYKRAYRDRLDGLHLPGPDRSEMVDEVRCAFRLNRDVFREVAGLDVDYSAMSRVSSTTVTNRR
jgi:heme oxygenase